MLHREMTSTAYACPGVDLVNTWSACLLTAACLLLPTDNSKQGVKKVNYTTNSYFHHICCENLVVEKNSAFLSLMSFYILFSLFFFYSCFIFLLLTISCISTIIATIDYHSIHIYFYLGDQERNQCLSDQSDFAASFWHHRYPRGPFSSVPSQCTRYSRYCN